MNLATGTVLQNGKYVLETVLGQGGFGITYRAHHAYLDQPVVVKVLNENLRRHSDFAQFQQQFIAEARRIAKCQHPNIVRVFDFFEDGGLSFIVMDYIPGQTLADIVQAEGPIPEAKAIHYIRQIGAALQVVHQAGLLHRDVKPHNIIRREHTDFVVLIDFGIAREFTPGVTQTHTGMLSAGYAPIEQYLPQGKRAPALDIYALAATLYSLVTGQPPIAAPLRDRIPLLDIRQSQPQISLAVERAILKGMEMEAHLRPQSLTDWLAMLPESQFAAPTGGSVNGMGASGPNPGSQGGQPPVYPTATSATLPVIPRQMPVAAPPSPSPAPAPPANSATVAASPRPTAPRQPAPPQPMAIKPWLPKALLLASAIAAIVGGGLGLALRLSGSEPGGTIFNRDQSFPDKPWPGTEVPASIPPDVPVEQPAGEQNSAPPPTTEIEAPPSEEPVPPTSELTPEPTLSPAPEIEASPIPSAPIDPIPSPDPVLEAEPPVSETPAPPVEPAEAPEPLPPASAPVPSEPEPPSEPAVDPAASFAPAAPPADPSSP